MTKAVNKSALKGALLAKTGARKTSLKVSTAIDGVAGKAIPNDLLPALAIEQRGLDTLKPAAQRVRKAKASLVKTVMANIAANGFLVPILVRGDEILDGHIRYDAAEALALPTIPVIDLVHLSVAQCELVKVAVNRTAELGEWDLDVLRDVIIKLDVEDFDLSLTGFTMPELDIIKLGHGEAGQRKIDVEDFDLSLTGFTMPELDIIKLDGDPEPKSALNDLPEPTATVTSQSGDLWQLSQHLLLCGSATEPASYGILLDGNQVDFLLSDLPYNVKIAGNVSGLGKKKHGEFVEATGEMSDEQFTAWLTNFCIVTRPHLVDSGAAMMFMDWRHIDQLITAGNSAGFQLINMIVWDKQRGGMGGLYRSAHELIAVFCNGATTPVVNNVKLGAGGRDRSNVWSYPGATTPGSSAAKMLAHHPTPKPVELLVDAMLDVTHEGGVVLDPFMGSGSTIIAGEECGRRVRGIELDPKYVDCAVRRWEQVTGQAAVLVSTGQTFAEVEAERAAHQIALDSSDVGAT